MTVQAGTERKFLHGEPFLSFMACWTALLYPHAAEAFFWQVHRLVLLS